MRNLTAIVSMVIAAVAAVSAAPAGPADLLWYHNEPYDNENGNYRFSFELTDGTRHEQRAEVRNKGLENEYLAAFGEYSWVAPNGVRYIVKYVADDNGYNPQVKEEPPGGGVSSTGVFTLSSSTGSSFSSSSSGAPTPFEITNALIG